METKPKTIPFGAPPMKPASASPVGTSATRPKTIPFGVSPTIPAAPAVAAQPEQDGFLETLIKDPLKTLLVKPAARATEAAGRLGLFGDTIKTGYEAIADSGRGQRILGMDIEKQRVEFATFNLIFYLKMLARFSSLTTMTLHGGQYVTPSASNVNADQTELWAEAMITRKISGSELYFDARVKFRHLEWNDVKIDDVYRKDDEWTFYLGSYYRFTPELKAGISYQFRTDNSNNDIYDFEDNQVTIYGRYSL
jgi:hypothetical protein